MPQAIKHFSGNYRSTSTSTVYTCPADTVALVVPTLTIVSAQANRKTAIKWNGSAISNINECNLLIRHNQSAMSTNVTALSKYDIEIGYYQGYCQIYFQPGQPFTGIDSGNYGAYLGQATDYKSGRVSSNFAYEVSGNPRWNSFKTGHWAMSSGDVLSHSCDSSGNQTLYYNYLILEEAEG